MSFGAQIELLEPILVSVWHKNTMFLKIDKSITALNRISYIKNCYIHGYTAQIPHTNLLVYLIKSQTLRKNFTGIKLHDNHLQNLVISLQKNTELLPATVRPTSDIIIGPDPEWYKCYDESKWGFIRTILHVSLYSDLASAPRNFSNEVKRL